LLVTVYFFFAALYTPLNSELPRKKLPLATSFGRRLTFVLFEMAFASTVAVIVVFWSTVFNPSDEGLDLAFDILEHGVIAFWILLELFLNRITFLWSHLIWELLFVGAYFILNYFYTTHVGIIYTAVTYASSRSTETVIGAIILAIAGFILGYALALLRDYICSHTKARSDSDVLEGGAVPIPSHADNWPSVNTGEPSSRRDSGDGGRRTPRSQISHISSQTGLTEEERTTIEY